MFSFTNTKVIGVGKSELHCSKSMEKSEVIQKVIFSLEWSENIKYILIYIFISENIKYALYFINIFLFFTTLYIIKKKAVSG